MSPPTSTKPLRPILCRVGSKAQFAKMLNAILPPHRIYVEPFVGSGAVFFYKEPAEKEIINDLNTQIADSYKLIKQVSTNPSDYPDVDTLEKSKRFWESQSKRPSSDPETKLTYNIATQCSGWMSKPVTTPGGVLRAIPMDRKIANLPLYKKRLEGVVIRNQDYEKVMREFDSKDTLFFCDPPYEGTSSGIGYAQQNEFDFERFAKVCKSMKGKVIVTLNDSPKIRELFKGFKIQGILIVGTGQKGSDKRLTTIGSKNRKEVIMANFPFPKGWQSELPGKVKLQGGVRIFGKEVPWYFWTRLLTTAIGAVAVGTPITMAFEADSASITAGIGMGATALGALIGLVIGFLADRGILSKQRAQYELELNTRRFDNVTPEEQRQIDAVRPQLNQAFRDLKGMVQEERLLKRMPENKSGQVYCRGEDGGTCVIMALNNLLGKEMFQYFGRERAQDQLRVDDKYVFTNLVRGLTGRRGTSEAFGTQTRDVERFFEALGVDVDVVSSIPKNPDKFFSLFQPDGTKRPMGGYFEIVIPKRLTGTDDESHATALRVNEDGDVYLYDDYLLKKVPVNLTKLQSRMESSNNALDRLHSSNMEQVIGHAYFKLYGKSESRDKQIPIQNLFLVNEGDIDVEADVLPPAPVVVNNPLQVAEQVPEDNGAGVGDVAIGIGNGKPTQREKVLKMYELDDKPYSLDELAKLTKTSKDTLQEVYNRGIGAYTTNPTSVRMQGSYEKNVEAPMSQKLSKEQWAMARVYSFLAGNPKHDTDLRGKGKEFKMPNALYLKEAQKRAKQAGYTERIEVSDKPNAKLMLTTPEGKKVYWGKPGYGDYLLWSYAEKQGDVPKGFADQKRDTFQASHSKLPGKWKQNKYSPNMLALKINW